jgi:hypothetical protein
MEKITKLKFYLPPKSLEKNPPFELSFEKEQLQI